MKVLVLGASGFIGNGVAKALVRGGHQVLGQTRSASHGKSFDREESEYSTSTLNVDRASHLTQTICFLGNTAVELVESDPLQDDHWLENLDSIDVIVDALGGSAPINKVTLQLIKKAESRVSERHPTAAKLVYKLIAYASRSTAGLPPR